MSRNERPVVIVRRPRKGGHGSHGGAWKIAYADFMTAMMALFLLLWLLGTTTDEQRRGISDFFTTARVGGGGAEGILQGRVLDVKGETTSWSSTALPRPVMALPPARAPRPGDTGSEAREAAFERVEESLRAALREQPELAESVLLQRVPEGLQFQLVDQENQPMFASGSARLLPRMERALQLVAPVVAGVPNALAISGHTDGHPFTRDGYGNWELSADRANAARRVLVAAGVPESRFLRVQGLADRQPLVAGDPLAAPNRRIGILLLSEEVS